MNIKKLLLLVVALALMAGTAGALTWLRANQKLGQPGIKATVIPGSVNVNIDLPAQVPGFTSTNVPEPEIVVSYLPKDTSYAGRLYTATNGLQINNTVILMGADRTSIHNADFCLGGQGFTGKEKFVEHIPINGPHPYSLPVTKWNVKGVFQLPDGQKVEVHGIYVFWFVADGEQTPDHFQFMKWLARDLLCTGVLQRWAYVAYFAVCLPGQEDAAFEQMKKLIALSVPELQPGTVGRANVKN